jgi:hypothetical protein
MNRCQMKIAIILFAAIAAIATHSGCMSAPKGFGSPPITGIVVDAVDKKPLVGANVVAQWTIDAPGGRPLGSLKVLETVTDSRGTFTLPGWGPLPIPSEKPYGAGIPPDSPAIIVFKAGYATERLFEDSDASYREGNRPIISATSRGSRWNNNTLALQRRNPDWGFYSITVDQAVEYITTYDGCALKHIPHLATAVRNEKLRLAEESHHQLDDPISRLFRNGSLADCGDMSEFFKIYSNK